MSETLSAHDLASEAKSAYFGGDYDGAAQAFEAAARAFQEAGDGLSAAEMRNNCSVAYLQSGDGQAALQAVEGTASQFARVGDFRRQGMALGNLGAALEALNRLDEAARAYEQSGMVLKVAKEEDLRMYVVQALSALQMRRGQQVQALETMQAGLEDVEQPTPKQAFLKRLLRAPFKLLGK